MGDLEDLAEAVEAGLPCPTIWRDFAAVTDGDVKNPGPIWAFNAYHGSLDAARKLHDALLPTYIANPMIGGAGAGVSKWHCNVEDWDTGQKFSGRNQPNPARAWLLAILRALIAENADDG